MNDGMSQCWESGVRLEKMAGFVCLEQHMFKHLWCLNVSSCYQLLSVRNYDIDISAIQMCNLLYVEKQSRTKEDNKQENKFIPHLKYI